MKGLVRGIGLLVLVVLCYKGYSVCSATTYNLGRVQRIDVLPDVRFSPAVVTEIVTAVKQHELFGHAPCKEQIDFLTQQFSCIADCSLSLPASGIFSLTLHGPDLVCRINNKHVVTKDGLLVEQRFFTSLVLESLPLLCVSDELCTQEYIAPACKEYLVKAPLSILQGYVCHWKKATEIVLRHKEQPLFSIVCSNEENLSPQLVQYCAQIMRDLDAQGRFKKTASKTWVADVRFNKQIVVYAL